MPFSEELAHRAARFFPTHLRHVEGPLAGRPLELAEWQTDVVRKVFGTLLEDGRRVIRKVYMEVPRKNGKSTFTAGLGLRQLVGDREVGARVYIAACDRGQAGLVYDIAERMVRASPELSAILDCSPSRKVILFRQHGSKLEVLSGEDFRTHGINASCVIFDELHVQRKRGLYEALSTSMGARAQPLFVMLTTAGFDRNTICGEQHEYALKVRDGILEDPTYLPVIYAADPADDPYAEATWRKANPSWDSAGTAFQDGIREAARRAKDDPYTLNTFLRLHLNIWTRQDIRWLPMDAWDASAGYMPRMDELRGRRCVMGLDMASSDDIAAAALLFYPEERGGVFDLLMRFWVPEDTMPKRRRTAAVPYDEWASEGLIVATPGNTVDYAVIEARILQDYQDFRLESVRYDPWNMGDLPQRLNREVGREDFCVRVNPTFQGMSAATKELLRMVMRGQLRHGGNKVLRWMADNVTVIQHPDGRVRPAKDRSKEKIDGITAVVLALDGVLRDESEWFEGDGNLKIV